MIIYFQNNHQKLEDSEICLKKLVVPEKYPFEIVIQTVIQNRLNVNDHITKFTVAIIHRYPLDSKKLESFFSRAS